MLLVGIVSALVWAFLGGWKFAAVFLAGAVVAAIGHVCPPERDHAHVRTVLDEQRKREGFLRHS
jgi:hypothetical protein